jgi:hypothetical protein
MEMKYGKSDEQLMRRKAIPRIIPAVGIPSTPQEKKVKSNYK